ncbi:MAG: poly(3-hydroxybutyrate) synthase subunit [Rhodocyclaceae bacterium]|nr:poly(3-hydroxybutyrate) synthase subunit [Rhodocyclaceae bacterium]
MAEWMAKERGEQGMPAPWRFYERMDRLRLRQGEWLDALGWGPRETPSRVLLRGPCLTLKGYPAAAADGPVVLLVPAPIKRAYIWDLAPGASVVQACLERGLRPYVVQWEMPGEDAGLADYADRFLRECIEAIAADCGTRRAVVAGHSLGGILAAIFAALNPELVAGLVLLGAPLHFSPSAEQGALGPVVERAGGVRELATRLPPRVPGSLMTTAGFVASPMAFGRERWTDWWRSLLSLEAIKTHMQVERWTLDELPLAGRLVEDIVEQLYGADAFMAGTLSCGGRTAAASRVTAPLLAVAQPRCPVVPPAAVLPFVAAAASREKRMLWYEGDVGVAIQHVGLLVGHNAHARLWPEIVDWIYAVWPGKLG